MHGIQTWVALPLDDEDIEPSFAHHAADTLPVVERNGVTLRVIAGTAFGQRLLEAHRLIIHLRCGAAENSSRPHQLEGAESFPRLIAIHHGARDEQASKRGGVEAVTAEPARQP